MELVIGAGGGVRCLYGEAIDLAALGRLAIERASHVEPDAAGRWLAELAPVGGPMLGPYVRRAKRLPLRRSGSASIGSAILELQ